MLDAALPLLGAGAAVFAAGHAWRERQGASTEPLVLALEVLPFAALLVAFLVDWDALSLVRTYGSSNLPLHYRISAAWAGRAGPLLLWVALLALVRLWLRKRDASTGCDGSMMHASMAVLLLLAAMLRPFRLAGSGDGRGEMNALLQTDLMVIHPPLVFLYYALCVAVAATVIESIRCGRTWDDVHAAQLRPARAALLIGAIGIGLGGLWAYTVLDWGGYWAWDPVETASLLPWLACLLIVHLRVTPKVDSKGDTPSPTSASRWGPPLGLLAGALAFHSTMVTRANGVWASVHAFVSSDSEALSEDAWKRVIDLLGTGVEGVEVALEFALFAGLLLLATWLIQQRRVSELRASERLTLAESQPLLSATLLIGVASVGAFSGDSAIFLFGIIAAVLLVRGDGENPERGWIAVGVSVMLLGAWSWHLDPTVSFVGMALFLAPWVLLGPEPDGGSPPRPFSPPNPFKLLYWVPLAGGGSFLLLTWLLLLSEIDGASLPAHETYGAPLIALLAAGLTVYSLRKALSPARANALAGALLTVSIAVSAFGLGALPGDATSSFSDRLDRGDVARFLLVWLLFALGPMTIEALTAVRALVATRRSETASDDRRRRALRTAAAQLAHLGILLLLVGHVMTTTLVARGDPIHQTTLLLDEPVQHGDLVLTMRGIELSQRGDAAFDDRFSVGDAFVGINLEVSDGSSAPVDVTPGMLRFDSDSGRITARSEVARVASWSGDSILILDASQANELMSRSILGGVDEVQRVRLTVYDLTGSHLVWLGWVMVVIGSAVVLASERRAGAEGLRKARHVKAVKSVGIGTGMSVGTDEES